MERERANKQGEKKGEGGGQSKRGGFHGPIKVGTSDHPDRRSRMSRGLLMAVDVNRYRDTYGYQLYI